MRKRIVSFLMALVMAVSLLPVSALAADTIYTNDSDTSVKTETQSSGVYKDADDTVVTNMKVRYGKSYLPDFFEKGKKEYTLAVPEGWTGFVTYLDVYVNEKCSGTLTVDGKKASSNSLTDGDAANSFRFGKVLGQTPGKIYEATFTVKDEIYTLHIIRKSTLIAPKVYLNEGQDVDLELTPEFSTLSEGPYTVDVPSGTEAIYLSTGVTKTSGDKAELHIGGEKCESTIVNGLKIDLNKFSKYDDGNITIPVEAKYVGPEGKGQSSSYTIKIHFEGEIPTITKQPLNTQVDKGETATLSVEATCTEGELSYQWYKGAAGSLGGEKPIDGATDKTLKVVSQSAGRAAYVCYVTNTCGGKAYLRKSDRVIVETKLSHITPAVITSISGGGECIEGEEKLPLEVRFTNVDALDYVNQKIEWYRNTENSTSGGELIRTVEGQNNDTFTPKGEAAGTYYYYCVVTLSDKSSVAPSVMTKSEETLQIIYKPYGTIITLPGAGTEANPYKISSLTDLETVRSLVEQGYSLQNQHFLLTGDIALPADWKPIGKLKDQDASLAINDIDESKGVTIYTLTGKGTKILPFSGILDGGGHTITIAEGGLPLLGIVRAAEVKNLNIFGKKIASYGLVHNYIVDYGTDGDYNTGCPNTVVIDHVTLKSGSSTLHSGFIGGYASGANTVEIRNCVVENGVTIGYDTSVEKGRPNQSIGSFAGDFNGTVTNCVSYATVNGTDYVGGLVGRKGQSMGSCVVQNSRFHGTVNASGNWAGGILGSGYYADSAPNTPIATVKNCLVTGTVYGGEYVGGIFGGEPVCEDCWANGTGGVRDNVFFGTLTTPGNYRGGIVGFMKSVNQYVTIANNYYLDSCGADKVVGKVEIVDDKSFTDARCGAAATAEQMRDGTVVKALNNSDSSFKNWTQGTEHPIISDVAVAYELVAGGELQSKHYVGDALNLSGLTLTAKWSDGTTTNVPLNDPDLKITGYDSGKHGQQTVTLQYSAAKVEIVVTVLYKEPEKIAVTITLLGDTNHGDNGEVHGLSKGGLTAWVSGHEVEATTNMTVWDALQKLPNVKWENPTGNYIKGVTYGGVTLGELDNGKNSGWMYTLNDEYPLLGVSEQYLKKGDVIVFHYTDDYTHDFAFDADKKTAKEIVAMIAAIGTVDLGKGSAITAARTAYDALTDSEKALVTNYAVLTAAEKTYAGLVAGLSKKLDSIYKTTGDYLSKLGTPGVGSIGGEWMVLGLARSGRAVPSGYYDNVVKHVRENIRSDGRLDRTKTTENARIILALTAMGKDPTNVGGYNLLDGFYNMRDCLKKQGVNVPIFALLALDSHNYTPTHNDVTRDGLVELILSDQVKADGGWALEGADAKASDVDMTAMAIQSLAPYYDTDPTVREAVDKALVLLSSKQQAGGGFTSWGSANSESCAQVIVALTALGIDPASDSRFIKNGATMLDALCSYYVEGGGFKHTSDGTLNGMATEQGYYALAAYYRLVNKQTSLYDMTDVCPHSLTATAGKAATCTEAGNSAYWTCSRCHKFFSDAAGKTEIAKDSWVIAALGHDEATRAAVAATCYASGHEADTYCKRCGMVINAGANIPATGKHTYVNGVCTTCGTRNPAGGIKGDDLKVDSKDNTIVTGGGLTVKTDKPVTDEKLAEIKAAVENGSIVITVNNTPILQLTKEDKEADGGKNALMQVGAAASGELKKELDKLAEKLDALRGDSSRKNAQLEKIIDVTVELVKTNAGGSVESVAQLTELPRSVTVTVSITNELYDSLKDKRVCVVRSHTDANGNVTTTELPATLGGTKDNYVLTFQTDKASAFAIVSYETVSSGYYYGGNGSADSGKKDSANTADDSQMVLWLGSAVLAAAAVVVLTRKKRVSK